MSKKKYVVILESDNGYMDCVAVCDSYTQAYGEAFIALVDSLEPDDYYITLPDYREGENGFVFECRNKANDKTLHYATVLFYTEGGGSDDSV